MFRGIREGVNVTPQVHTVHVSRCPVSLLKLKTPLLLPSIIPCMPPLRSSDYSSCREFMAIIDFLLRESHELE